MGLVLGKDEDGMLDCGEKDRGSHKCRFIPNAVYKTDVIRIVRTQAIDGEVWQKYGV
jgi:hypothetical protein